MSDDTVSKKEFAALVGVTPGRVSQWLAAKQISGAAIVGSGHRARIRVSAARAQLARNLDVDQRLSGNGKAKLDERKPAASAPKPVSSPDPSPAPSEAISEPPPHDGDDDDDLPVEEQIKRQRLELISLANAKAREEAAARSGRYVRADAARQEMGRVAGTMIAMFDGAIVEFGNAIAAHSQMPSREALRLLRTRWREIRARQAKSIGAEAALMPTLLNDEGEDPDAATR